MAIDWSVWGPPLGTLVAGGVGALVLLMRTGNSGDGDARVGAEARALDLENTHQEALQALKHLETERQKLPPADYELERARLVQRGGRALQALEEAGAPMTSTPQPGPVPPPSDLPAAPPAAAAVPVIGAEWRGALYALAAVALAWTMWTMMQGEAAPRGDGSMTGNLPNQAVGGNNPAPQDPTQSPEFKSRAAALEGALQTNPKDIQALNGLTELYLSHGVPEKAFEWSKKALEADPKDREARVYRAVLTAMMGMLDQGVLQLDQVLAEEPTNQLALVYKGLILLELGRFPESAKALEIASAQDPENPMLRERLAQARAGGVPGAAPPPGGAGDVLASGTVQLDPAARAALQGGETLFLSLGTGQPGPPVAAERLDSPLNFPIAFELSTADIRAMGAGDVPAVMEFKARLDRDGNAMTKEPGLPLALVTGVARGTTGLVVTLTLDGTPTAAPAGGAVAAPAPAGNPMLAPLPPAAAGAGDVLVSGRAVLAAGQSALGNEVVFVSVKDPAGGPPLAVKKLSPVFPLDFTVTRADIIQMAGPRAVPAQVTVSVRLDRDGNATTKDGPASEQTGVATGATGLSLTLQ
jgi:tetratricopeptide (TPR) repeat protein